MATFASAIRLGLSTTEFRSDGDLAPGTQLLHSGYDVTANLTASSTPDVTKAGYGTKAMTAGAATLDLTVLTLQDAAVTITALDPRAILFTAASGNAGAITIVKGASNGYDGLGAAFSLTLEAGQSAMFYLGATGNAVSGTNKTFDLSGTGTDSITYGIVAGT
jgi:hypothetical protein